MANEVTVPTDARAALASSPLGQLRRLVVTENDAEVVITGTVPSYYLRQMAQETIRHAVGHRMLLNRVQVYSEGEGDRADNTPPEVEIPASTQLAIKALIESGVSPDVLREGLLELYRAMNEYHMALGAGVLSLEDFRRFVRAEVAVEV